MGLLFSATYRMNGMYAFNPYLSLLPKSNITKHAKGTNAWLVIGNTIMQVFTGKREECMHVPFAEPNAVSARIPLIPSIGNTSIDP